MWYAPNFPSMSGCVVSARPARPLVVAMQNGTANQTIPPMRKPITADLGLAATALCQYDWLTKTVPKLPTMLVMPKMSPMVLPIVRNEVTQISPSPQPSASKCLSAEVEMQSLFLSARQ